MMVGSKHSETWRSRTGKGGSIGSMPACSTRDPSSNPTLSIGQIIMNKFYNIIVGLWLLGWVHVEDAPQSLRY